MEVLAQEGDIDGNRRTGTICGVLVQWAMGARVAHLCGRSTNIGSVPVLLYGADRASSKQASRLTFQSGRRRLGRRYFVTVARPDHKNLAVGAKRLTQRNLQQILRLPPRAV